MTSVFDKYEKVGKQRNREIGYHCTKTDEDCMQCQGSINVIRVSSLLGPMPILPPWGLSQYKDVLPV